MSVKLTTVLLLHSNSELALLQHNHVFHDCIGTLEKQQSQFGSKARQSQAQWQRVKKSKCESLRKVLLLCCFPILHCIFQHERVYFLSFGCINLVALGAMNLSVQQMKDILYAPIKTVQICLFELIVWYYYLQWLLANLECTYK